jgi:hypothetical protein
MFVSSATAAGRRLYSSSPLARCMVPVIDVGPLIKGSAADKKRVAKQIGAACENIGVCSRLWPCDGWDDGGLEGRSGRCAPAQPTPLTSP